MHFLIGFGTGAGIQPMVTVSNYISFMLGITIPMGVVFEIPMASYILTSIGIVNSRLLRRGRRIAILAAFVVAAIFAPPDAFSMLVMAAPMLVLYEAAIMVASVTERRREARQQREAGLGGSSA
jgi:sec-independent protein translocase protein TatC